MAKQNNTSSQISTQSVEEQDIPEVQNELSKVATNPKQSILILLVISAVFIFIFFKLFIADNKPPEVVAPSAPTDITKPTQDNSKNLPEIPKLPEAPKLETPVELPPPPPPPPPKVADVPKLPLPTTSVDNNSADKVSLPSVVLSPLPGGIAESDEEKKRREAKRKSSIVLIAGVPEKKTPSQIAEEANFQDRGDMAFVLGRGKIIEAVLETAINTDLGGEVRAIISRDVFSEREKIILVPKGSKIFGAYTTGIDGAYGRIAIIWNRIDLSNGYTITLDAIAVDNLGRKGEQGRVDNKYKERLTNAVLLSAFNIGLANALDKVVAPPVNSQAAAANAAVANIQSLAQSINNGPGTEDVKISQICSSVMNAISDKTSSAYISMMQACNTAQNPTGSQPGQRLVALMTAVTNAAASLLTSTPTQAQAASKQAFTDISNTMKGMIQQHEFKPTITIDQGTVIKIYVNKDYKFPQSVLRKSRLIK
ncbi:TrbI/VirB10 family protein [Candidatus Tisiphia endosymbiont of Parasteatoda lunata]|uniref:TrbI/VirB10 family protein n=1 Tax=Candidatus Tisiphia endosymbiont of Parasteatoda lunata TaxID=3066275 RepID=UPI00313BDD2E